jgi:hypothetical protein
VTAASLRFTIRERLTALRGAPAPRRLVLPSPNGSAIVAAVSGLPVFAACLRNSSERELPNLREALDRCLADTQQAAAAGLRTANVLDIARQFGATDVIDASPGRSCPSRARLDRRGSGLRIRGRGIEQHDAAGVRDAWTGSGTGIAPSLVSRRPSQDAVLSSVNKD